MGISYDSGCIRCEYHQLLYFNHFLALDVVNSKAKGHSLLADHKSWELFAILLKFQERKNWLRRGWVALGVERQLGLARSFLCIVVDGTWGRLKIATCLERFL